MNALFVLVLAWMMFLIPGRDHDRDHSVLAMAVTKRVAADAPLFAGDESKLRTAALFVAIAYRESGFRNDVLGDNGTSFCAMQVSNGAGGHPALMKDADACMLAARRVLEWSFRACPAHPVALYAAGARGCTDERARRVSRDRLAIADELVLHGSGQ